MKTSTIRTNAKGRRPESIGQKFVMPSLTIQGETMTIEQLFARAANQGNFILQDTSEPMFLDVPDIEQITSMYKQGHDLVDLQKFANDIKDLNLIVQEANNQKQLIAAKAAKEDEKRAIIKAHNDEQNDDTGEKNSDK